MAPGTTHTYWHIFGVLCLKRVKTNHRGTSKRSRRMEFKRTSFLCKKILNITHTKGLKKVCANAFCDKPCKKFQKYVHQNTVFFWLCFLRTFWSALVQTSIFLHDCFKRKPKEKVILKVEAQQQEARTEETKMNASLLWMELKLWLCEHMNAFNN